jgi:hypothetical protein
VGGSAEVVEVRDPADRTEVQEFAERAAVETPAERADLENLASRKWSSAQDLKCSELYGRSLRGEEDPIYRSSGVGVSRSIDDA